MRRRKRHARDAPFVKSRGVLTSDRHVTSVPDNRRTCQHYRRSIGLQSSSFFARGKVLQWKYKLR